MVTVNARPATTTELRISSNDSRVPRDSRNTAWKMVELVLDRLGITAQVEIHIEKRLPVQGGLGAGSANAVAALIGLEAELGSGARDQGSGVRGQGSGIGSQGSGGRGQGARAFKLDPMSQQQDQGHPVTWPAERLQIAARVGSDVPLFLIGGTILGLDRGQEVYPLPDIEPVWCVVACPAVGVSTPQAFRDWDALCAAEGLTAEASAGKLNELSRAYASAFAGAIPGGRQGAGSSGVLPNERGPGRTARVRACPHRDHELDPERLRTCRLPPASFPCRNQASSCGFGHSGGSPPCLAVGVRFGALRVVPDPRRGRSGLRTAAAGGSAELADAHLADAAILGPDASAQSELTGASCARETRGRLPKADFRFQNDPEGKLQCWAIV